VSLAAWHDLNVWVHIFAGVIALTAGLVPLAAEKGGRIHRAAGNVFVGAGAAVLLTAAIGVVFFTAPIPLIAASLSAGYLYLSSLRALSLNGRGPGWIDAGLAMAGIAASLALAAVMNQGTASWTPALGYSVIGSVVGVALYDLSRHAWGQTWVRHVRPLDHGLKMTGAYFAMMSAGFGNVFRDAQPWSQIGPIFVGLALQVLFLAFYLTAKRRPTPP
jgi:hypothetical protein